MLYYDDSKDLSEGEITEIDGELQNQVALILPHFRKKYGYKFAAAPEMFQALTDIIMAASFCHADAGLKIWIDKANAALAKAGKE